MFLFLAADLEAVILDFRICFRLPLARSAISFLSLLGLVIALIAAFCFLSKVFLFLF